MAFERKRMDKEAGEETEVPVTSYQKGSSGRTETIPKKVIESIEKKVAPELSE